VSSSLKGAPAVAENEAAERAARVAAMLDRWGKEDVSAEPEWDVSDIGGASLREWNSKDSSQNTP
jgi:hypothetical protein